MKTIRKTKSLSSLKSKLKKSLPEKIMKVMQSYDDFSEKDIPDDAKGFTAHHGACKAAVIHAETLLKLARWTDDDQAAGIREDSDSLISIIQEARETDIEEEDE
ncbi:MAG: hypothetical protein LBL47_01055 [Lactobacillus sp.]|jgi:hypothetical protein|nr:hypothetical protein [Lactobacillus sp.]